jgi:hypothetical protein
MVGAAGFEPSSITKPVLKNTGGGTEKGTHSVPIPYDLQQVVVSWSILSAPIKAAILALIHTSTGRDK